MATYRFKGVDFTADELQKLAADYPHLRDDIAKSMLKGHTPGGEALPGAAPAPNAILERGDPNFKVSPTTASSNERLAMRDNALGTTQRLMGDLVQGGVGIGAANLAGKVAKGPVLRGILTGLGMEGGRLAGQAVRGQEITPPSIAEGALEGSAVIPGFIQKMLQRGVSMARHEKSLKDLLRAQGMNKDRIALIMQQIADFEAENKSKTAQLRADRKLIPQSVGGKKAQLTALEQEIEDTLKGTPEYADYQQSIKTLEKLDTLNKHGGARMAAQNKLAQRAKAVAALRNQYRKDRGYVDLRKEIRDLEKMNANLPQDEADLAKWVASREAFMKKNKIEAERQGGRLQEQYQEALSSKKHDSAFDKLRAYTGVGGLGLGLGAGHFMGNPVIGGIGAGIAGAAVADKAITSAAKANAHRPGFAKAVDRNTLQKLFGNIAPLVEAIVSHNRDDNGQSAPAGEIIYPDE